MDLNKEQRSILQAIAAGTTSEQSISETLSLDRDLVHYYMTELSNQGCLKITQGSPTFNTGRIEIHDSWLTPKGKVALQSPDKLIKPDQPRGDTYYQSGNFGIGQMNGGNIPPGANISGLSINNSNVGALNTGSGQATASQFSQAIAANRPDIEQLLAKLKADVRNLPNKQQAEIELHLDDLTEDLANEQKRQPKRLQMRLLAMWRVLGAIAAGTAGVADFSNNVLELSEKLHVPLPIEQIQKNPHILPSN